MRITVFWCLYWVPSIQGSYHITPTVFLQFLGALGLGLSEEPSELSTATLP